MKTDLMAIDQFVDDQEDFMNAIIESKGGNLPVKVEQVLSIFEFTDFKARAWKMMADKMKKLEEHSEAHNSALRSGQKWGIAALYAQKRMGDITGKMPAARGNRFHPVVVDKTTGSKLKTLKDQGISKSTYFEAEQIANNPEILERVIESSKQRGEIPTKTAVLNTIRVEKAKERTDKADKKSADKLDKQKPQAVSDYYESIKGFKAAINFAIIAAERGKFAPEGKNFLVKKNNEIRNMMNKLEELV